MKKLSTGQDSTLKNYKQLALAFFGQDSSAVKFLNEKIDKQGEDEEVLAVEGQMIALLGQLHLKQESV